MMNRKLDSMYMEDDKENQNTSNKTINDEDLMVEMDGLKEIKSYIENVKKSNKNKKLEEENDKLLRKLAQLKKKIDSRIEKGVIADGVKKKAQVITTN